METIQLLFQPGSRQEGFRWCSVYERRMVGLCRQQRCDVCDLAEREKLKTFKGGKLEVRLTLHRRPSFWEEKQFYLGHIVYVFPVDLPEQAIDEGFEIDPSRFNLVCFRTQQGIFLVDPGYLGFEREISARRLIAGHRISGSFVSHGHLDQFNLLGETKGPVFMSKTAFHLASRHASWQKQIDHQFIRALRSAKMVVPGEPILLNNTPLKLKTFALPHSIPETMGLVIEGQKAKAVYLGDFRLNGFEPIERAEAINRLSQIAKEGPVDFLALTIFNAHLPGFVPLESVVINTFTDIMLAAKGRVIITCFSTNLERIRRISEIARLLARPVQFFGAGMGNSQELLGIITEEKDLEKAVVFVTGCQAEEGSVLWRIANDQNSILKLQPDDALVFSSRCLPGNKDKLRQLYAQLRPQVGRLIVTNGEVGYLRLRDLMIEEALTHVPGHENREGLRLALEILKPKRVLAWPQTLPQIEAFREIAEPLGIEILDEKERVIDI